MARLIEAVVTFLLFTFCYANRPDNVLQGKNLMLVPVELPVFMEVVRNSTGQVLRMQGVCYHTLEWLAEKYGFSYSIKNVQKTFASSGTNRGASSYLVNHEADVVPSAIAITIDRAKYVDFSFPLTTAGYGLIIPFPDNSANIGAPWEAFEVNVWALLVISSAAVAVALVLTHRFCPHVQDLNPFFQRSSTSINYVVQVVFAQGGYCYPPMASIRLVAATWCLAAFVFVNIYNTILISFVSTPNCQLMINSVYDIPKSPTVRVVVDEGLSADVLLTTADSGVLKYLGDMLRHDPSLRCNKPAKCIDKVKAGSHAYVQPLAIALVYINDDFKRNGKCSLTEAKNPFLPIYSSFAMPKGSPFTDLISQGILALIETGLPTLWQSWYVPVPHQCLEVRRQKLEKPRLSMKHLSSAFVILSGGYCISFLVFIGEILFKSLFSYTKINPI